jgi:hypothetical protein
MADAIQHISFLVSGGGDPPLGESRCDPVVSICLQSWRQSGAGHPIIGPHLKTEQEVDVHIDALKANLEAVRRKAKGVFGSRTGVASFRGFGK